MAGAGEVRALVQALVAARGLASIHPLGRYERAWNFQFARLPSSSLLVLGLWWEQAVAAGAKAKMGAQGCRAQEPQAAQVFATVSVIDPSGVSGEPSRQQVVRPPSSSSSRLWQSHQPLAEGAAAGYCSISRVLQRSCRPDFVTDFEGWSLAHAP